MSDTCLNSRLVLRPAPYHAPVAVMAATAPVMAKIRALFGADMLEIEDVSGSIRRGGLAEEGDRAWHWR